MPNVTAEPELGSILMNGVAPSGSMDLARCQGSIRYEFRAKTASGEWRAIATVVERGMYTPILSEDPPPAVHAPNCTVAQVWIAAQAAGAKDDPCASVEYRNLWSFRGGGVSVVVDDATCGVVRSPEDALEAIDQKWMH